MSQRDVERNRLAQEVSNLSFNRLSAWGITRVADVTGLDTIGLPVYTACRPSGVVISISSGKGMTKIHAKAGAILEAVELWAAETPRFDSWAHCDYLTASSIFRGLNLIPLTSFTLAHSSPADDRTPICWDTAYDLDNNNVVIPSDLIWLTPRVKPPFQYFQTSSNGLAAGVNVKDAIIQAALELIERDGWSISEYIQQQVGQWAPRISLQKVPPEVSRCLAMLKAADIHPFIFDLTTDIGVPIFGCTLLDASPASPGCFAGYGCSFDAGVACRRAITEAAQARCCYIGCARDDLFRRRFVLMKRQKTLKLLESYRAIRFDHSFETIAHTQFQSIKDEWDTLLMVLSKHHIDIYYKVIYESFDPYFCVVRAVSPQLENPQWEHWQPGPRAKSALSAYA